EQGNREQKHQPIPYREQEERWTHGQFIRIPPERESRPETGCAADIARIALSEFPQQEALLAQDREMEHQEGRRHECSGDHQAAALGADAERSDETEDVEGIATDRIRPPVDDLRLLPSPD